MTNRTINLTSSAIKALPVPPPETKAHDQEWSDQKIIGLKILVGRTGNKRYLLRYISPVTKKKASIALGRFPDLEVHEARTKARKLKVQIADGIDPKLERDSQSANRPVCLRLVYEGNSVVSLTVINIKFLYML